MKIRLPSLLKSAGLAAVLLGGALAVLPGHVGAQVPSNGNLVAVTAGSPGSGVVTLTGYNGVAVTLNGAAYRAAYNVFSCTTTVSSPTTPPCQLDGSLYANSGGQATGSLSSSVPAASTAEVFVQNAANPNELYAAVFVAGYVPGTSCAPGTPITYVFGLPNCTPLASSAYGGVACNYINVYTGQPICVAIGGGVVLPFYGLGVTTYNTTCIVGGGLQPVLVNGTIVWEFC